MDKSPNILSESKHLELVKSANFIIKKLKDIKEALINKQTGLFEGLLEMIEFLNTNLENNFVSLRAVNEDHKIEALKNLASPGLEIK